MYTRDVTQAYVHSDTNLERDVYLKSPPKFHQNNEKMWKLIKPIYSIPESGLHWYMNSYHKIKRRLVFAEPNQVPVYYTERKL